MYDALTNIRVHFQKNAWTDEEFCNEDLLEAACDLAAAGYTDDEEILARDSRRHGSPQCAEDGTNEAALQPAGYGPCVYPARLALHGLRVASGPPRGAPDLELHDCSLPGGTGAEPPHLVGGW